MSSRMVNDLNSETKFYGDPVFHFLFNFLNFMKTRPNMTKATLREA